MLPSTLIHATWIPCGPRSRARACANPRSANFAGPNATDRGPAFTPADFIFVIEREWDGRDEAGGWQIATRAEFHEQVRAYLKSKPSAKLSLASLETLAVIAYKQPVTVPEILEIRGVQSPSAIKTLLDKRLIVAKGRKETVGRPMMYGTSKEFLIQFGLKDLTELPSIEDFQDLAGGE